MMKELLIPREGLRLRQHTPALGERMQSALRLFTVGDNLHLQLRIAGQTRIRYIHLALTDDEARKLGHFILTAKP